MSDSIWDFLVRNLGGRLGSSRPGLEPTVSVGTHAIQNPASAIPDPIGPIGPIMGPVGPAGPMVLDRETGRPQNEPPLLASVPGSQPTPWDKVKKAGAQIGQIGTQRATMSAGMPAPQVYRGQPMNLIDAVFGVNTRRRDY